MKILITSGGTRIPIDRVRRIENMSTGNFGQKIAFECLKRNHQVLFLRARGSKSPFSKEFDLLDGYSVGDFTKWYNERASFLQDVDSYREEEYFSFDSYKTLLESSVVNWNPDVVVLAAAVSDYGVANYYEGKIRTGDSMSINLVALPKLISTIKPMAPNVKLVGFKMLVDSTESSQIEAAKKSIKNNGCDLVVANDLTDIQNSYHKLILVKPDGTEEIVRENLSERLVKVIETL